MADESGGRLLMFGGYYFGGTYFGGISAFLSGIKRAIAKSVGSVALFVSSGVSSIARSTGIVRIRKDL
jgi:hypothetical protein